MRTLSMLLVAAVQITTLAASTLSLPLPPPDRTAPGAITDLVTGPNPAGFITLSWTAVGDDGPACAQCFSNSTPVTRYDLRYSTAAPGGDVNAWFSGATQATGEPTPIGCGCRDGFCLFGLAPGTTYYVALKAIDEANNASGVSNVVSSQTGTATGAMHISAVQSSWFHAGGVKKRGLAFVNIVDALGDPVPCATVTAQWSGCYNDTASGITDSTGRVRIVSNRTASCFNGQCCFIVTVTNVTHPSYTYDSGANIVSGGMANCNPFAPTVCPPLVVAGCDADVNGDGFLTGEDFDLYVGAFEAGDAASDFDGDGSVTGMDFDAFVRAFEEGC